MTVPERDTRRFEIVTVTNSTFAQCRGFVTSLRIGTQLPECFTRLGVVGYLHSRLLCYRKGIPVELSHK
jgi:hypothetical protein